MARDNDREAQDRRHLGPGFPMNEAPMRDVEGKVAFITGSDSGIGLGVTIACINAGMKVVGTYRTPAHRDETFEAPGVTADRLHLINVDVTDRAAMTEAAQETIRVFGKIHVLINNAGVVVMSPLSSTSFDDWSWCMNVNVNGVFNGIRAFLPLIKSHGEGGQIVATSSMLGGLVAGGLWGAYSASKFAVVGMMEALRSELASTSVGVSVFCPAGVLSNLGQSNRNRPGSLAESDALEPDARIAIEELGKAMQRIPGRTTMDPLEAGERLLRGIRNNDLYILSHSEYEEALRERSEALLASIPRGSPIPEGRLAAARILHNAMYVRERDRRRQRCEHSS